MTINTCTQKWCFEIHRRTKEQKTEIEIAEKSFKKFYYKDQILSILQLQELKINT
jgi:hypothetical protein